MRVLALSGALATVGVLAACLLPSLDGIEGGSSTSIDAGLDAPHEGASDASAPFSCNGAAFCSTFDTADPSAGWTGVFTSPGSQLGIDSTRFVSPPGAFSSRTAPGQANDYFAASVYTNVQRNAAKGLRLQFALRVLTLDPTNDLSVGQLAINEGANSSIFRLWMHAGVLDPAEEVRVNNAQTANPHHPAVVPWVVDRWMKVQIEVDAANLSAKLSVDGTPVTSFALVGSWLGTSVNLSLGVFYSAAVQTGHAVLIDDVRLDRIP